MDGIISLGPFMIATDRALAIAAIWAFLAIATWIAARTGSNAGQAGWTAIGIGFVAARLGYVLENLPAFLLEPWTVIAVWQGGFSPWVGVAAAALALLVKMGRRRATVLMLGALGGLSLTHAAVSAAIEPKAKQLPEGLQLTTLTGRPVALDGMRGHGFVLNLWATWCPPCRREMPMVIDVAATSSVPVLLVNQGEPAGRVKAFLSINDMPSDAILLDATQRVAGATGARAYPTTIFVNADGEIVRVHAGEISRAALTSGIRELERKQQ
ncbi:TlpA disulfide reductase family protein [Sphingomonas jeddahensis]|nr:TlpA disulfide reductase family protein [Sphingomonas jeddahensis]